MNRIVFIIMVICGLCSASNTDIWEHFPGIPSISNTTVTQDNASVWIGTLTGLVSINKESKLQTWYNKSNSGLKSNRITTVTIDTSGTVWVTLETGEIQSFKGGNWTTHTDTILDKIKSSAIISSAAAPNGDVWFGTSGKGIIRYNGLHWSQVMNTEYFQNRKITAIAHQSSDTVWIGTDEEIVVIAGGVASAFVDTSDLIPDDAVSAMKFDIYRNLWITFNDEYNKVYSIALDGLVKSKYLNFDGDGYMASIATDLAGTVYCLQAYDGIFKLKDSTATRIPAYDTTGEYPEVCAVCVDQTGNIWVVSSYSGWVARYQGGQWERIALINHKIIDNHVKYVKADISGAIWIGTSDGLCRLRNGIVSNFTMKNSILPADNITALAVNGDTVFAGTSSGIVKISGDTWDSLSLPHVNDKEMWPTALAASGTALWMGTDAKTVYKYEAGSWTAFDSSATGYKGSSTTRMAVEGSGTIWFGGSWGIMSHTNGTWSTAYNKNNSGMPDNQCYAISVDKSGVKWIGTVALARFNGTAWRSWTPFNNSPFPSFVVADIAVDSSNNKWFCAGELARYSDAAGGSWTHFAYDSTGLPSKNLNCITIAPDKSIWIGTADQGLVRFVSGASSGAKKSRIKENCYSTPHIMVPSIFRDRLTIQNLTNTSSLKIMNLQGGVIKYVKMQPGQTSFVWCNDDFRNVISSGRYLIAIENNAGVIRTFVTTRIP